MRASILDFGSNGDSRFRELGFPEDRFPSNAKGRSNKPIMISSTSDAMRLLDDTDGKVRDLKYVFEDGVDTKSVDMIFFSLYNGAEVANLSFEVNAGMLSPANLGRMEYFTHRQGSDYWHLYFRRLPDPVKLQIYRMLPAAKSQAELIRRARDESLPRISLTGKAA